MTSALRGQIANELTTLHETKATVLRLIGLSRLSSLAARHSLSQELHMAVEEFRVNAQRTKSLLDEFGAGLPGGSTDRSSKAEFNRYSSALQALVADLDQAMRSHLQSELSTDNNDGFRRSRLEGVAEVSDSVTDTLLAELAQSDLAEELLLEREHGIRQIQQDVVNLRGLFTQVAYHVNQQGALLDDIEANVESTVEDVQAGTAQVRRSWESSRPGWLCNKCPFSLLMLIGLLGILLFIGK